MGSGDRRGRHRTRGRLCRHRSGRSVCGPLPHSLAATWAALRDSGTDGRGDASSRGRRRGVIRYNLICDKRHEFESWFQNSAAYDKQAKRGLVSCPLCGSSKVEKAIMAPRLARKMHYGEVEHRSIYGEASPKDAKELHDEGIEFHPLPVLPEDRN